MSDKDNTIILMKKTELKAASLMLARAFVDDPINDYAYSNQKDKEAKLPYSYEFMLRYGFRYGENHKTAHLEGVTVWVRSNMTTMSFWRLILSGAFWPSMKMGQEAGIKMQRLSRQLERKHKALAPFPHWYLMLLGVDPEFQGRGHASTLLRTMFGRTDAEGLPCYLETETEKNVSFYEHLGFKVLDTYTIPGSKLQMWLMLRDIP